MFNVSIVPRRPLLEVLLVQVEIKTLNIYRLKLHRTLILFWHHNYSVLIEDTDYQFAMFKQWKLLSHCAPKGCY